MNIGDNIRECRKKAKLSQKELGKKLGVSQQHIAQYERGKRQPKIETLRKIANALGVSIDYLKTGKSTDELWKEIMKDVYKSSIGQNIREQREKQGLTQKELADYTGLTEATVQECEESKDLPPLEIIKKISLFLAININKIVEDLSLYPGLEEDMKQNPSSYFLDYGKFLEACERTAKNQEKLLLEDYRKLNSLGQTEARKRLNELTEIKKYTEIEDEFYK
ncbi:MAG: helix-turn-helix domain-containing protein [Roseburia sp.]|nr:helix-turn-helix domain-containing protein [Roseburia sp.]